MGDAGIAGCENIAGCERLMFYHEASFRISTLYVLNVYACDNQAIKSRHIQNPVKDSQFWRQEFAVWCDTELSPMFMEVKGVDDDELPQECSAVAIWFPKTLDECNQIARAILLSMNLDAKLWKPRNT